MAEFNFFTQWQAIAPEIGLTILAIVVLFLDVYGNKEQRRNVPYVAAIGMALLAVTPVIWGPDQYGGLLWGGMIRYDGLSQIFKVMILLGGALVSMMAVDDRGVARRGEFYLIIVVATLGGTLMSAASDLIMVFVALETLSIPLYILATFNRHDEKSVESGLKYFLFGSFASAIMLYGFSLLYGFAGTTSISGVADALVAGAVDSPVPVLAAMVMVIVGFGFKISAVPFHFWTPDVYEGAPTPVTAYVSVASKAASFALVVRFFLGVFPETIVIDGVTIQDFWVNLLTVLSIVTMTLGNVLALRQTNIKRLLAYSSIAQAGYTLIGVVALQADNKEFAVASVAFYMFMYTFTNLLAFTGVVLFSEATGSEEIKDFAGLNRRSPWLALAMTVGLLSLAGIPPAAGFFGKFFLFQAAVDANLVGLAMIGVLNAIVALYYYLVIIKVMYVDRSKNEDKLIDIPRPYAWALGFATVVVILLGTIAATPIYNWAVQGAAGL